jgi:hypothetical protein
MKTDWESETQSTTSSSQMAQQENTSIAGAQSQPSDGVAAVAGGAPYHLPAKFDTPANPRDDSSSQITTEEASRLMLTMRLSEISSQQRGPPLAEDVASHMVTIRPDLHISAISPIPEDSPVSSFLYTIGGQEPRLFRPLPLPPVNANDGDEEAHEARNEDMAQTRDSEKSTTNREGSLSPGPDMNRKRKSNGPGNDNNDNDNDTGRDLLKDQRGDE